LTPCPPAVASPTASRVARCREPRPISALSASMGPPGRPQVPLVVPARLAPEGTPRSGPELIPLPSRQRRPLSEPEARSAAKSRSARPTLSRRAPLSGPPLVLRLCRREPSFRHAFTRGDRALDPRSYPVVHRSSRATCRSSTSATGRSTSTPSNAPDLDRIVRRQAAAPTEWRHPLRGTANRASPGQGLRPIRGRFLNPHHGDRSPRWIYPNLSDSRTSCRRLMPGLPWKSSDLATVR
jgi:hypothetical protein